MLCVKLVDSPFASSTLTEVWNAALRRRDGANVFLPVGGCAVLTAEIPAFWEVVGEAAPLASVSIQAPRNGLERLIEDVSLRCALGDRTVRRDADFSREHVAREPRTVIEKLVESGHK